MDVIVATNEPWGTYHLDGLVTAAVAAGIRLRQFVPDLWHVPHGARVEVVADERVLRTCDLLVVNGLYTEHTRVAAYKAYAADRPLAMCELAYMHEQRGPGPFPWVALASASPATQGIMARHARVEEHTVEVVGHVSLDDLPAYDPVPGRVLALTSVSAASRSGGASSADHVLLDDVLAALSADGHEIVVRPHPREARARWEHWALDDSASAADAISRAALVVAVSGSTTTTASALGAPILAVPNEDVPAHIQALVNEFTSVEEALALLPTLKCPDTDAIARACGPIGGAAERVIAGWQRAFA